MMFGQKPRGMLGLDKPGMTPPYMPPQPTAVEDMPSPTPMAANAPIDPGVMRPIPKAKSGPNWLLVALDALSAAGGNATPYADARQRNRTFERQQQMAQQNRENDWQDFQRQYDYQAAHPKPVNNDTTADYNFITERLGKPAADDWLRRKGDPMVNMTLPGNNFYSGPASGVAGALGGGSAVPSPVVKVGTVKDGYVFKGGNPADPNAWQSVQGGPVSQAPGRFR